MTNNRVSPLNTGPFFWLMASVFRDEINLVHPVDAYFLKAVIDGF